MVLKSATICKDDLIGAYIFLLTLLLGFVLAFIHTMSPGQWGLNYYICLGRNPDLYSTQHHPGSKFPVTVPIALLTFGIYTIVNYKLYRAKKKSQKIQAIAAPLIQLAMQPIQPLVNHQKKEAYWEKFFPYANKFLWSSVNLITMYIVVIMVVTEVILWNFYMKNFTILEMKSTTSGHFVYIYHQYILAQLCLWSVAINTLVRSAEQRKCKSKFLFQELNSKIDFADFFQTMLRVFSEV